MQISYSKCCLCIYKGDACEKKVISLPYYGVCLCEEHIGIMNMMIKDGET